MRRYSRVCSLLAIALFAAVPLSGCGGNGGTTGFQQSTSLTRSGADRLSPDAVTLAAREASDVWIPQALATEIDADLKKIRQRFGQLEPIRARPENDLYSLLLEVAQDAPWRAAWEAGTLTTGDAAVDDLLRTYKAVRVQRITSLNDSVIFALHFQDPLNPRELVRRFDAVSTFISGHPNGIVGDGNQITRESSGAARIYTFSRGWGDCPSGCIYRRDFKVTLNLKGDMTLEESGDDPNATPGVP
jgi:hypothetical protein